MNMVRSLSLGTEGENYAIQLFTELDIKAEKNEDKETRKFWDLDCKHGKKKFTAEVKYDIMAQRTGNIAIEYYNSKSCEPSGIEVTTADIWLHILRDGANKTCWVASVAELKKFIKNNDPFKNLTGVGDNNACIYLYRDTSILDVCLYRVDNLSKKDARKLVGKVIK